MTKTLVKGGEILSMDDEIGRITGDVLIEGDRILAIGPDLEAEGAEVIDAAGAIVMPGFVNAHLHTWQGSIRAIAADWPSGMRALFGHGAVKPKPKPGEPHTSEIPHPRDHIERLRRGRLASDDALVTLAMCLPGPDYSTIDVCRKDFALAKELGLISSAHVWGRRNRARQGDPRLAARARGAGLREA